jgi:hypothetical protein
VTPGASGRIQIRKQPGFERLDLALALLIRSSGGEKTVDDPSNNQPAPGGKIRFPKPARIYVAGNGFTPNKDQIIFGAQGFFHCHGELDRNSLPPGVDLEGIFAFGGDVEQFCEVALSAMFDATPAKPEGRHPGAYYLDAVILGRQVVRGAEVRSLLAQLGGDMMMTVMLWEGEEAKVARELIPGGKNA